MIVLVIEYLFILPLTILMVGICLLWIWIYLKGLFSKSGKIENIFHYMVWGNSIIVGFMIYSFAKEFSISDYPTSINDLKVEIIEDLKSIGFVIASLIGGGVIFWIGLLILGIVLGFLLSPLYLVLNRISNTPFKRIKIQYKSLLKSIDFLNNLESDSFKQRCIDFKSINSLPFNFYNEFFINPSCFERKREGKRYSGDYGTPERYKNIQEYSEQSNWRYKVIIKRVNYLKVFSNISTSKNMLKFQFLINYLYIPLTIIFSIIEYHFFNYIFCLPILYSVFYLFLKKKYPKDFKNEYYKFNTDIYIISAVLFIPIISGLNYFIQSEFIIRTYENDFFYLDLGFTLLIILIILLSDLYDYTLERFMNSIFCRILLNEKLFCYFYTLNCFSVHLEKWVEIEKNSETKEKKWFYIKYDYDIDR